MSRFSLQPLVTLFAALMFFGLTAVQAQSEAANVPVRAVVSYANLMTPELAAELLPSYGEPDDFAFALVARHVADGTVCPATAEPIKVALINGLLHHEAFIFYLADTLNGTACAPANLDIARAQLQNAGYSYPLGDAEGYITGDTLTAAIVETSLVDNTLPGSDGSYDEAITPTTGQ